jgi:hypothetical protein
MKILFLLASILTVAAPIAVFLQPHGIKRLKSIYVAILVLCGVAAYLTTFLYVYSTNKNTRVCGWPIARMAYQRDGPDAPWLDYFGPTILFAYPMNLILYSSLPSLLILLLLVFRKQKDCARPTNTI